MSGVVCCLYVISCNKLILKLDTASSFSVKLQRGRKDKASFRNKSNYWEITKYFEICLFVVVKLYFK